MKLAALLLLASIFGTPALAAENYYLISADDRHAVLVAASTIRDLATGMKAADVYDVSFMEADLGKYEFDCTGKRVRVLSHGDYLLDVETRKLHPKETKD